jgi:uncharacterized membrane protein YeaQ/YmgE (transglycosylase-associated protein family)
MGCFTGLLFSLLIRSEGIRSVIIDAILGTAGGVTMAWFVAPISDSARDPDSLNIAVVIGAVVGAFVFVALAKALRGK